MEQLKVEMSDLPERFLEQAKFKKTKMSN